MTDADTQVKNTPGGTPSESDKPEFVTVTVDGVEKRVPRGTYIVSAFKQLVGVDASRELDEVVHGEFKPLDDNATIEIERHEKFVSHVRTGSSS
ncbi:MAG: hypothetical protein DMG35_20705 [Acidobacteria bacterium]|nr:MAG: hypothetical protein DMG35_20705 [Acidobacteriota bacterium]